MASPLGGLRSRTTILRPNQIFLARPLRIIRMRHVQRQRLGQRNLMAVVALERRRQFMDDARPQPQIGFHSRLLQERRQQEARQRPGQAERAVEDRRAKIERAIDIDLLESIRTCLLYTSDAADE